MNCTWSCVYCDYMYHDKSQVETSAKIHININIEVDCFGHDVCVCASVSIFDLRYIAW